MNIHEARKLAQEAMNDSYPHEPGRGSQSLNISYCEIDKEALELLLKASDYDPEVRYVLFDNK